MAITSSLWISRTKGFSLVESTPELTPTATPEPTPGTTPEPTPELTPTPGGHGAELNQIDPSNDDNDQQRTSTPAPAWPYTVVAPKKPQLKTITSPPVTNLRPTAVSANMATIAWEDADSDGLTDACNSVNPRVYRYTVMDLDMEKGDARRIHKKVEVATSTSVELTNLRAGGRYWVIVKSKGASARPHGQTTVRPELGGGSPQSNAPD